MAVVVHQRRKPILQVEAAHLAVLRLDLDRDDTELVGDPDDPRQRVEQQGLAQSMSVDGPTGREACQEGNGSPSGTATKVRPTPRASSWRAYRRR